MKIQAPSEFVTEVPLNVILQIVHPGGRRHEKRIRDWWTAANASHWTVPGGRVIQPSFDRRLPAHYKKNDADSPGNLENAEYRFWIGFGESSGRYSKCRFCGVLKWSLAERRAHQQIAGCTSKLVALYRLALAASPRRCLACNELAEPKQETWGVPLHPGCVRKWQFQQFLDSDIFSALKSKVEAKLGAAK